MVPRDLSGEEEKAKEMRDECGFWLAVKDEPIDVSKLRNYIKFIQLSKHHRLNRWYWSWTSPPKSCKFWVANLTVGSSIMWHNIFDRSDLTVGYKFKLCFTLEQVFRSFWLKYWNKWNTRYIYIYLMKLKTCSFLIIFDQFNFNLLNLSFKL